MNITNDIVTEYVNGFYRPLDPELWALREKAEEQRIPIILRETESFMVFLLGMIKPKSVLEIGTAVGYSAMVFARCGAEVVTVEKDVNMAERARSNIEKAGLKSRIEVLTGDGEEAIASNLEGTDKKFDLVFIDASKSHYKRFLDAALPFCHEDSLIICDNVLLKGATASDIYDPKGRFKTNIKNMRTFLRYITEHPNLETVLIPCGDGLALSRYKR